MTRVRFRGERQRQADRSYVPETLVGEVLHAWEAPAFIELERGAIVLLRVDGRKALGSARGCEILVREADLRIA